MAKKKKKRASKKPTWAWSSSILGDILNFNKWLDTQFNNKANFLMGASGLILVYTAGVLTRKEFLDYPLLLKIGWGIIAIGCFFSFLMAILIVTPKIRILSKKERIKKDIFYYKNISQYYTRNEYIKELDKLKKNSKKITEAFENQIYSLSQHILPIKSRLLKRAGWTLVFSLVIGIGLIMINTRTA
ncbi:hypothetical protein DRJ17_01815 [Candidatus Woesearchaeota archaeon]|nr:MAG: hypothetical protein DRJ17_01815 [Candidatus Woesearchaeota archaeon]